VRSLARTWTTDLKARRIRVNAISPGSINAEGLGGLFGPAEAGQDRLKGTGSTVPRGWMGNLVEIAKAALFLASDDSSLVPKIELMFDGGFAQG
jgi:NAD(P)-dependent dehydrogenase (short-subunit alcohol dehydrogenase family)